MVFKGFEIAVTGMGIPRDWLQPLETIVRDIDALELPEETQPRVHWDLHCPWPAPLPSEGDGKQWDRHEVERATWIIIKRLYDDGWGYREMLEFTDLELEGLGIGPSWQDDFRGCVEDLHQGRITLVIPRGRVVNRGSPDVVDSVAEESITPC